MMKKIMMGLFMIVLMIMSSVAVIGGCIKYEYDSDPADGNAEGDYMSSLDYKSGNYGYSYGHTYHYTDYCLDSDSLREYYCLSNEDGAGNFVYVDLECEQGCESSELERNNKNYGRCVGGLVVDTVEVPTSAGKAKPIKPECNDGWDNDGDGQIDTTGGCDVDGDEELSTKAYVEEWNIYISEIYPEISAKFTCEDYYNGVWYEPDTICTGEGGKGNPDAGENYNSESLLGVTRPSEYECSDGLDNDGDGYVDYDNGNGGWCDVDNNGEINVKAYSDIIGDYLDDESTVTKCQCENTYGYGNEACAQLGFWASLFGGSSSSGKELSDDGSVTRPVGNFFLWLTGNALKDLGEDGSVTIPTTLEDSTGTKSIALPVTPPNTDECITSADCDQSGKFGSECIDGVCVEITSGSVTRPIMDATWYEYDPNCDNPNDDAEKGTLFAPAPAPEGLTDGESAVDYCKDGWDNDNDGLIDSEDPGCTNGITTVNAEYNRCGDGYDNDGDGYVDTADPECSDSGDDSERDIEFTAEPVVTPSQSVSGGSGTLPAFRTA
ncbi:MAG: hypothetical protein ABIJ18_02740 [archaeon]